MDVGEMQRKLSVWSMQRLHEPDNGLFASRKDLRLYDLYQLLCDPTWLCAAHDRVSQNTGSKTAGCDGINMARFDENLEERLQILAEELRTQTYRPQPVRRVYIPGDHLPVQAAEECIRSDSLTAPLPAAHDRGVIARYGRLWQGWWQASQGSGFCLRKPDNSLDVAYAPVPN